MDKKTFPLTLSVPEAGRRYYGISRNAAYRAAERGDLPVIRAGQAPDACRSSKWSGSSPATSRTSDGLGRSRGRSDPDRHARRPKCAGSKQIMPTSRITSTRSVSAKSVIKSPRCPASAVDACMTWSPRSRRRCDPDSF